MNSVTNLKAQNDSITYSTNPKVTPALSKDEGAKMTYGWHEKTIEWNETSLIQMVKNDPYIPSKLKDGHKVKTSVKEMYFFAIDFDNGDTTFEEYKEKKVKAFQFSAFMHTTCSHQKELQKIDKKGNSSIISPRDKFRVIIPFKRPLKLSEIEYISHNDELFQQLFSLNAGDIDMSCLDANRFFKQNPEAITYFHDYPGGNHSRFFDPDILLGNTKSDKDKPKAALRKNSVFGLNDYLTLADGTEMQVKMIKEKKTIFCPFCDLKNRTHPDVANAFIDVNDAGSLYIFCSSEKKTYWQESTSVDATKSKLFWNTTVGCPSMIGYEGIEEEGGAHYVFKNDADFRNYCYQNNINPSVKDYLPRREIIFHPGLLSGLTEKYYNVFEESQYMKKDYSNSKKVPLSLVVNYLKEKTPIIAEVLLNVFGDAEYLARFLNWNAYILQKRAKADTAWLITSKEQGVGKDLMFNRMLQPLYGEKQSQLLNGKRIAKDFNRQDLNCFLRGYNEVFSANDRSGNLSRKEWLKDAITSKKQTVELKGIDSFQANNFMNFIIFSNNESPVLLDKNDRRFNVVRNTNAKKVSELSFYRGEEFLEIDIAAEIDKFAEIIFTLEFDRELVNKTLDTEAKQKLIALSSDTFDDFADALKFRRPDYFLLDEIFSDPFLAGSSAKELEESISKQGAILSRHMKKVVSFHFPNFSYKQALEKLKSKGVQDTTIRINDELAKGYKIK